MERQTVKSASRTLEVLELFAESRRPLRLSEVYTVLNYPQSSTTSLLKSLVTLGYLNYNRTTREYLPTVRVSMLGSWLATFIQGKECLRQLIDRIQAETDETVGIATRNDLFIQYAMMKSPVHAFKEPPSDGTMRLMLNSSAGIALLSQETNREIDKIVRYTNYYGLSQTGERFCLKDIMREVNWARQTGYCHLPGRPTPEVSAIAFPLGEDLKGIPLAIGVGGFDDRISRNKTDIVMTMRRLIGEFKSRRGTFSGCQESIAA